MQTPEHGLAGVPPLGSRVVVRHRLPVPDPRTGATLTDVVGDLVHADPRHLVVRTRRGVVEVASADVTALKEVPPAPARRGAPHLALSVDDLQRVMVGAWPATETEHLGDWLLRAAEGFTGRANSVMTAGDPGLPLDAALDRVRAWYTARGLPSAVTVAGPVGLDVTQDPLGALLLERGHLPRVPTRTLTAAVTAVCASTADATAGTEVQCSTALDDDWFAAFSAYREAPRRAAEGVLTGSPDQVFARVRDASGAVVAIGRLGVAAAWGGIGAMWVAPSARRRGLASAVLGTLAREAAGRGVRSLHLQTDTDNVPALATYGAHGFRPHHDYVTLRRA
ncbi:GNAT family N-acetyltransferase [Phycicoccus duodecadis]|uniref:Acetyltransferase (GNAT) family protein n=1 Tax=Phycicoccus duodecadis TaxID=173053 RepID=A0A2N3YH85_9MICO|nr:GNAT family N-acetyltransferase [Phycicoccus duodecadis]PKW26191.1 acetyltransferase (GNAT) family protein [Phycicoccus duodecadis]